MSIRTSQKIPFLNPDPLTCWCGTENIAHIRINDESCWALLYNGSMVNAVTPELQSSLLWCQCIERPECGWLWETICLTLGLHYHKGSGGRGVALVWRSSGPGHSRSNWLWLLGAVILDTPAINWIINVIKENKIDKLSLSLNGSRISHLLAGHWAELSIESKTAANCTRDPTNLNEAVKMTWEGENWCFFFKDHIYPN